jgi:hypothetical protein
MKKIILILILVVSGLTVGKAQNARDLYLGYGKNETPVSAPTNDTANLQKVPKNGQPGTKVTIELMRDGKLKFVKPNSKFRSGDKIRLRFATNFDGYIRILNVGSSGKVSLLFPYNGANDRITPSTDFQIPNNNDWIVFDDTPGTEMLTVILSAKPFEGGDDLSGLNSRATKSRDLTIQSDDDATYAVFGQSILQEPVGFTLQLKHK